MLESSSTHLEGKLKFQVNEQKSRVVSVLAQKHFKFLGFCLGKNVRQVMEKVKVYIRGWLNHFYAADMRRNLQKWNKWLRRRFRMYIWKQWKMPRTKVQNLSKLGVPEGQAYQWGDTRLGYWRVPEVQCYLVP